jgi:hypothetical protein
MKQMNNLSLGIKQQNIVHRKQKWILYKTDYGNLILWVRVMVFNTTFNNISVISWWSVLLVKETGENHWPVASQNVNKQNK